MLRSSRSLEIPALVKLRALAIRKALINAARARSAINAKPRWTRADSPLCTRSLTACARLPRKESRFCLKIGQTPDKLRGAVRDPLAGRRIATPSGASERKPLGAGGTVASAGGA